MRLKKLLGTSLLCAALVVSNMTVLAADAEQSLNVNTQSAEQSDSEAQAEQNTGEDTSAAEASKKQENAGSGEENADSDADAEKQETEGENPADSENSVTDGEGDVTDTEQTGALDTEEAGTEAADTEEATEFTMDTELAVYNGITIDGDFSDWNAVKKTQINDGSILDAAVVFDGDWVYIYIKDAGNGAATWAGERHNGTYELLTDTGRRTSFILRKDGIQGVSGAKMSYAEDQYEIAIPSSALKAYRSTISFGYSQAKTPMIGGIANMQGGSNIGGGFAGITIDGNFNDWTDYNHQLIQYSTNGAYGDDADGALYISGSTLYGHVKTYRYATEVNPYNPITLRFNNSDAQTISFYFVSVDGSGNVTWNPAPDTSGNSVKYYLVDVSGWHGASTLTELEADTYGNKILGEAYIRMGKGSDTEIEYQVDLEKLAEYISDSSVHGYTLAATDMKTIQAQYINIGTDWITIAGTSSGPVAGVVLSMSVVACVLAYRRRKEKGIA